MLLRVARVESFETPEGELGRRIELVEERPASTPLTPAGPQPEEVRLAYELAHGMLQAMQAHLPMFRVGRRIKMPKIILFLTEAECEQLGLDFTVNQLYEVELSNGAIRFRRAEG
ncbi:hypothetical protein DRO32_01570 [Candidatus Bathyarchaeota archaeon]|nr:MAG: hypothetical protein DRO32_01570 [Candidatus Bathyarchaeota archaeon]